MSIQKKADGTDSPFKKIADKSNVSWLHGPSYEGTIHFSDFKNYGIPGLSAYEVAVENGFEGTEQEWLDSLASTINVKGEDTYANIVAITDALENDLWIQTDSGGGGNPGDGLVWTGTEWLNVGAIRGPQGIGIPVGGAVGDVVVKNSGTDYDVTWVKGLAVVEYGTDTTTARPAVGAIVMWIGEGQPDNALSNDMVVRKDLPLG